MKYVEAIGARLGQATGRPDISWQWSVADDGDANAFAASSCIDLRPATLESLAALDARNPPLPKRGGWGESRERY